MLVHLVKKDFMLAKKYWLIMLIAAIAVPFFLHTRTGPAAGGPLSFFLSTLYIAFLLFNAVSMMDYKYRGAALLCTTPYTRSAIVQARYLFVLAVFLGCYVLYTLTILLSPVQADTLGISDMVRAFFAITLIFAVMIPIQYRFGYEKSRLIFFLLVFLLPFGLSTLRESVQVPDMLAAVPLPLPPFALDLLLVLLALLIAGLSMRISVRIFSKISF